VQRANDRLPRQGNRAPWQNLNDYLRDLPALRFGPLNDGHLRFYRQGKELQERAPRRGLLALLPG